MTPHQKKLHDCLIMIGKEAEKQSQAPTPDDLYHKFDHFMTAIDADDMSAMSKASRELAGDIVRFMVEKL